MGLSSPRLSSPLPLPVHRVGAAAEANGCTVHPPPANPDVNLMEGAALAPLATEPANVSAEAYAMGALTALSVIPWSITGLEKAYLEEEEKTSAEQIPFTSMRLPAWSVCTAVTLKPFSTGTHF